VHDSRGIEIVNFTISLALSAGTLMASAGTPYRLVPAHFYPCHGGRCWGIRWSGDGRPQLARPLPPRLLQHGAATHRRRDSGNERANNAFRAPTAHPDIPPRCGRKAEAPCSSLLRGGVTDRRPSRNLSPLCNQLMHAVAYLSRDRHDTILRCYFNVRSKADMSQIDLQHGTRN